MLVAGGCGGKDKESPAAEASATTTARTSDEYRAQVEAIVRRSDEARGNWQGASGAEALAAAERLAGTARLAGKDVEALQPPESLAKLNSEVAENYQLWAAKLEAELKRKQVSTLRLGDVVREYGQRVDKAYEEILIAP